MRIILTLLALGVAWTSASAEAADRIFADGFEPCCTLGGEVGGLTGNGLVLRLAAGALSEDRPIAANGIGLIVYTFSNTAIAGIAYAVTITSQPSDQTCTLSNASGTVASAAVLDINATCVAAPAGLNWDDASWDDANWQ